jgi:SAM-dependent methyltransferase
MPRRSGLRGETVDASPVAIVGEDPCLAEPGCGARIDGARDVVRLGPAHESLALHLGAAPGRRLTGGLADELRRRRAAGDDAFLCGFDPRPHRDVIAAGVEEGVFVLAGAMYRALGARLPVFGLHRAYACNPVAYFDDTGNRDEWQKEVYDHARELAVANGYRRILDVGCGSGYKLVQGFEPPRFETIGLDLPETIQVLAQRHPTRRWMAVDLERESMLRFRADLIIASDIIEHLADPDVLLRFIADCDASAVLISTPDAELLTARGQASPLGPPRNPHHVREWTRHEFSRYVATHLDIVSQHVYSPNATQLLVCRIPERARTDPAQASIQARSPAAASRVVTARDEPNAHGAESTAARLADAPANAASSVRAIDVIPPCERIAAPYLPGRGVPQGFVDASSGGYTERSRTRALEAALSRSHARLVAVACSGPEMPPEVVSRAEAAAVAGAIAIVAPAPALPEKWSPVDGFDVVVCDRTRLLAAIARERGPHGVERALLRLIDGAEERQVSTRSERQGTGPDAAALLARLEALIDLLPDGPRWPDPRSILGPRVREAVTAAETAGEYWLAADLAGYFAAQTGGTVPTARIADAEPLPPSHPELAVPLDDGSAWLALDLRDRDAQALWLEHARKPASSPTLTLAPPWAAGIPICAAADRVVRTLHDARLDTARIAPITLLERPLWQAELAWLATLLGPAVHARR